LALEGEGIRMGQSSRQGIALLSVRIEFWRSTSQIRAQSASCEKSLRRSLMLTSGAMTHRIDCLEELGLVERKEDPTDRRGTLVALTPQGKTLIDRAAVAHVQNEAKMVKVGRPTPSCCTVSQTCQHGIFALQMRALLPPGEEGLARFSRIPQEFSLQYSKNLMVTWRGASGYLFRKSGRVARCFLMAPALDLHCPPEPKSENIGAQRDRVMQYV
jgi:DNA-binding MarR family transcriptional regulator